jgi:hypothetical protein
LTLALGQQRTAPGEHALLLEFSVPLPLFDSNQAVRQTQAALAADAAARHQRGLLEVESQLRASWFEATQMLQLAVELRQSGLPEATRLSAIASTSFAAGELDLIGLLDACEAEIELREKTLNMELRARRAVLQLEYLTAGAPP